jgi:hypothetical protein
MTKGQPQSVKDPVTADAGTMVTQGRQTFPPKIFRRTYEDAMYFSETHSSSLRWYGTRCRYRISPVGPQSDQRIRKRPALGTALIQLFGFVPEAWKTKVNPAITTQCPDPNNPVSGTCTMHSSSVDLSVTLASLGLTGAPTAPVFVPTPNHSHVVDNSRVNTGNIWWEVRPVLVMQQSDWPTADGSGWNYFLAKNG